MRQIAQNALHLMPEDYDVIGPERFGQPGLVAVESVGPGMPVKGIGPIFAIHDSTFEPRHGIGHHPHQGMERLFYILEGEVHHDDAQNGITGVMRTGDLGVLTEGRLGMVHAESNPTDGPARCWILVYPCEPLVESASFAAVRREDMPVTEAEGRRSTHVVQPGEPRLHGDVRILVDAELWSGGVLEVALNPEEAAVVYVLEGELTLEAEDDGSAVVVGERHSLLWPPSGEVRRVVLRAHGRARVLHAVTGS